jgi:hypothetical protein
MSIFSDTMKNAISNYRQMLRKYLPQAERVSKLNQLNLRSPQLYQNEIMLHEAGYKIVEHLFDLDSNKGGYYAYSGIAKFGNYLKEFLDNYLIDGNRVIHKAQKTSQALVHIIQLLTLSKDKITDSLRDKINELNDIIATYGSEEQHELYETTLQSTISNQAGNASDICSEVLQHFLQLTNQSQTV